MYSHSNNSLLGRSQPRPRAQLADPRLARDPALAYIDPALWPALSDQDQLDMINAIQQHLQDAEEQAAVTRQQLLQLPQGPVYPTLQVPDRAYYAPSAVNVHAHAPSPVRAVRATSSSSSTTSASASPTKSRTRATPRTSTGKHPHAFDPLQVGTSTPKAKPSTASGALAWGCPAVCRLSASQLDEVLATAWEGRDAHKQVLCPYCATVFAGKTVLKGHLGGESRK